MHVPTRVRHVSGDIWLIGGIPSEHILVIGVTRQCPAEGFFTKKGPPRTVARTVEKFLPRTGGGLQIACSSHCRQMLPHPSISGGRPSA
jgi:hypothetical protein